MIAWRPFAGCSATSGRTMRGRFSAITRLAQVADWNEHFVSGYAGAHPWEDWAETWAHYLHMTDTLETAAASGLSIRPSRADEPLLYQAPPGAAGSPRASFDRLIDCWFPLTYVLNNLSRGLGLPDAYPFVLSPLAIRSSGSSTRLSLGHQRDRASVAGQVGVRGAGTAWNFAQRAD